MEVAMKRAWVAHIAESCDGGTADLLHHLPLLRPANGEAKAHYLALIPKVLAHTISQANTYPSALEKARQLLSYSLIHPALSAEERRSFASWLRALEDKFSEGVESESYQEYEEEELTKEECRRGDEHKNSQEGKFEWLNSPMTDSDYTKVQWNDYSNVIHAQQSKEDNRWGHLDVPHSPNNSGASSRSSEYDSYNDDSIHVSPHPGMRDIGVWLKSLRLHKYSPLLCSLRYDELLSLNEDILEQKGVTKGARHKIILSIAKLKERTKLLETIEKELMSGGSVTTALNQLKLIAVTPMLPSQCNLNVDNETSPIPTNLQVSSSETVAVEPPQPTDSDLPSQFTRVMGKVCTQLLVCARPDDESVSTFLSLVDRCLNHEAFTVAHTRRLLSWKQQILRIWHPLPPRTKDSRHTRRWSQQYSGELMNSSFRSGRLTHQRYSSANSSQVAGLLAAAIGGNCLQTHLTPPPNPFYSLQPTPSTLMAPRNSLPGLASLGITSLLSPQHFLAKRPSLQETPSQLRPHVTLQRTRSAPSRPHQLPLLSQSRVVPPPNHMNPERQTSATGTSGTSDSYSVWISNESGGTHNVNKINITDFPCDSETHEVAESDITNRLESLCLSMTEHALE